MRKAIIDYQRMRKVIVSVLCSIQDDPRYYQAAARKLGMSLEQLTAAALTEALREDLEKQGVIVR